jgi:hypothetical protein
VRETNSRLTADLLVDLAIASISDPTGSPVTPPGPDRGYLQ